MIRKLAAITLSLCALFLSSCKHNDPNPNQIIVGTIAGPETQLMQTAKDVAQKKYGLTIKIRTFTDYDEPNKALYSGAIEANAIQDKAYLKAQNSKFGYNFVILGNTFMYPIGLYSNAINKLSELKNGATVAIPNSDIARSLLLLQSAGFISIKGSDPLTIGLKQITSNKKQLHIVPMEPVDLTQALNRVELAIINTNYSQMIGLLPTQNALFIEPENPLFMNVIVTRSGLENEPKMKKLVKAFQSHAVYEKAKEIFGNDAVAGFQH